MLNDIILVQPVSVSIDNFAAWILEGEISKERLMGAYLSVRDAIPATSELPYIDQDEDLISDLLSLFLETVKKFQVLKERSMDQGLKATFFAIWQIACDQFLSDMKELERRGFFTLQVSAEHLN